MGDLIQIQRPVTSDQAWQDYLTAHERFLADPRDYHRNVEMIRAHARFTRLFLAEESKSLKVLGGPADLFHISGRGA